MTQQDKDREAFEAEYAKVCKKRSAPPRIGDDYLHDDPSLAWKIWQAARNHYAPKLTGDEALAAAFTAFTKAARRDNAGWVVNEGEAITAALRAAGMQFKEGS